MQQGWSSTSEGDARDVHAGRQLAAEKEVHPHDNSFEAFHSLAYLALNFPPRWMSNISHLRFPEDTHVCIGTVGQSVQRVRGAKGVFCVAVCGCADCNSHLRALALLHVTQKTRGQLLKADFKNREEQKCLSADTKRRPEELKGATDTGV